MWTGLLQGSHAARAHLNTLRAGWCTSCGIGLWEGGNLRWFPGYFMLKPYLWKENSCLGNWGSQPFYQDGILHTADFQPPRTHQHICVWQELIAVPWEEGASKGANVQRNRGQLAANSGDTFLNPLAKPLFSFPDAVFLMTSPLKPTSNWIMHEI